MKETDRKEFKSQWLEKYVLTPKEVEKLIQEKIERAKRYHEADNKRKALIAESR